MNTVRDWWYGSAAPTNAIGLATQGAPPQDPKQPDIMTSTPTLPVVSDQASVKQEQQRQTDLLQLQQAAEHFNETKALYDTCEQRRMTAVVNGKDAQDYSCEREFAAFKNAFDRQLALESRMPIAPAAVRPPPH
jgi:hypothetical protein